MKFSRPSRLLVGLAVLTASAALCSVDSFAWAAPEALAPPGRDSGPWVPFWPDLNNAINARVKQGNVDLIFVGDSITQLWANQGKEVWHRYYGNRNAVNMGIGGDMVEHVLWRLDRGNIDGISPKLAVVLIGTNNSTAGTSPENIAKGVKAIVDKLKSKLPKTKILVMGILPRAADDQDKCRQNNKKANAIIAKMADDKTVFYLDIGAKYINADGTIKKELLPDAPHYLHLSAEGFQVWAEAIEPTVAKLMGESGPRPAAEAEEGFVPIFNGHDLTGWDGKPGWWYVENGAITAQSTSAKPCTECNYLIWQGGKPGDFELRMKYRLVGGNSGVQIRSLAIPNWDTRGYQADIDAELKWTGALFEHARGGIAMRGEKVVIDPDGKKHVTSIGIAAELAKHIKENDWNDCRIVARGSQITLAINGVTMSETTDNEKGRAAGRGVLGLQMHPGPPMKIQFKDLRIKIFDRPEPATK